MLRTLIATAVLATAVAAASAAPAISGTTSNDMRGGTAPMMPGEGHALIPDAPVP